MTRARGGRTPGAAAATVALATALFSGCATSATTADRDIAHPSGANSGSPTAPPSVPRAVSTAPENLPVADPSRVRVPVLDVDAPVGGLGLDVCGALEVPTDFDAAGWYVDGPEPGEPGPAVVVGHVDDYTGPAVFHRLETLEVGDEVLIDRGDGTTATFRVRAVEAYAKDEFPTERVYGRTPDPELRLITCGGEFDRTERSYLGNVVVYADLVRR
ncbi:class F sortase [Blastococcus colisei]|uniref:class F sortase n=1 Tax=Blastococcus colisei TaxID=1564162 RepID=UPI001152A50D|nr:class F sortase [Blastococcus colisei]